MKPKAKKVTMKMVERSKSDKAEDRKAAMRKGVTVEAWEDSPADKRADRAMQKKMQAKAKKGRA